VYRQLDHDLLVREGRLDVENFVLFLDDRHRREVRRVVTVNEPRLLRIRSLKPVTVCLLMMFPSCGRINGTIRGEF
jgi:hypothetical protein